MYLLLSFFFAEGFPDSSVGKESTFNAGVPGSIPGLERSAGEGIRLPTPVFLGFPCGSAGKESACYARDLGSIPGLGRSPGEGKGYPPQYSGLENSTVCIVHGVTKSQTWLSNFHQYFPLWECYWMAYWRVCSLVSQEFGQPIPCSRYHSGKLFCAAADKNG